MFGRLSWQDRISYQMWKWKGRERRPGLLEAINLGAWAVADTEARRVCRGYYGNSLQGRSPHSPASRSNRSWWPTAVSSGPRELLCSRLCPLAGAAHNQWVVNVEAQKLGSLFSIQENSEGPFQSQRSLKLSGGLFLLHPTSTFPCKSPVRRCLFL